MTAPFIHLRVHTEYSISDGIVRIKPLVAHAREHKMPAVGITDASNVFAMVKFYAASVGEGIKPLIGVDFNLDEGPDAEPARLTLFAMNRQGYRHLCDLLSRGYLDENRADRVLIQRTWVEEMADHLIALSGGMSGDTGQALRGGHADLAKQRAREWVAIFGDRYYLEITRCGRQGESVWANETACLAIEEGIPLVATNDVRFPAKDDFEAHETRVAIHDGRVLADPRRQRPYTVEQYLKSDDEMKALFSDLPEAIENTSQIAMRCNLVLDLGKNVLPDFPVPEGYDTDSFLKAESEAGLAERLETLYPDPGTRAEQAPTYQSRLDHELAVIASMGFPGYFLIVADFIRWSRNNGVPVGPGRGSGAGSLVAYALGITDLDPLAYDLLFERFLNPERVSMPDFDVDFCMDGRDRVIEYVAEAYGQDRVSQIITYGSMAARAVLRDVGRVLGHPYGMIDRIAKMVPPAPDMTLQRAIAETPELAALRQDDEEVAYLIDTALSLEGLARNPGKHAGGVVIAPSDLNDFTPLYCEPGGKNRVTQFDKDDVEKVGLVKFDFLGLRTLTIIDKAVQRINARREAEAPELNIRHIPLDDAAVFDLLSSGETTAIFQLESAGMRRLIKRLKPAAFEDIIALVALYRPGPLESGMVEDFIDRKHGAEVVYPHESLAEVLEPTYGVILYQEQVMKIAQVLAGYTLGHADLLRRAMGKKKPEEMAKQRDVFVSGAVENGVAENTAVYIFDLVEKFAGYGFNKSHSAAYALLAYQTAWLKHHYPAEFMAAVLSADMDDTDKVVGLIDECQRLGISVIPPDVNASQRNFSVVDSETILYGMGALKGLGVGPIEAIVGSRTEDGPYASLYDFCRRIEKRRLKQRSVETLIQAGALDQLGANRASMMQGLPEAMTAAEQDRSAASAGQNDMFGLSEDVSDDAGPALPVVEDWEDDERLRRERNTLGLYLTGHPIKAWAKELARITHGTIAEQIDNMPRPAEDGRKRGSDKRETIAAGLVVGMRKVGSGKLTIVVIDDGTSRIECPIFQDDLMAYEQALKPDRLVVIEGTLAHDDFTDGIRLSPTAIRTIAQARRVYAKRVMMRIQSWEEIDIECFSKVIEKHQADSGCDIVIVFRNDDAQATLTLGSTRVTMSDSLMGDLTECLGQDNVYIKYGSSRIPSPGKSSYHNKAA